MDSYHMKDLRTLSEVAASLRVSEMTVYGLVRSGELPALRMGRDLRIPGAAVRAYVDRAFVGAV